MNLDPYPAVSSDAASYDGALTSAESATCDTAAVVSLAASLSLNWMHAAPVTSSAHAIARFANVVLNVMLHGHSISGPKGSFLRWHSRLKTERLETQDSWISLRVRLWPLGKIRES